MFCPKCGTENADGSAFCNRCGASISHLGAVDFAESNSAGQTQAGNISIPKTKLPIVFRMWFIILLLFSYIGTIFGIVLLIIRLVKYPRQRKPALIFLCTYLAIGVVGVALYLYDESTNQHTKVQEPETDALTNEDNLTSQQIQKQETQEVQQETDSAPYEESESTREDALITKADTDEQETQELQQENDSSPYEEPDGSSEAPKIIETGTVRSYTHEEILATLLHEEKLKEYGIKPNCASERKKVISKIEKALARNPVYAKDEEGGFFEGEYLAITSGSAKYIYYGDVKNNRPDGFGVITGGYVSLDDLSTLPNLLYAGNFKKGKFDGYGVTFFHNGNRVKYDIILEGLEDENMEDADLMTAYYMSYVTHDGYHKGRFPEGKGNRFQIVMSVHQDGLSLLSIIAEWGRGEYSGKVKTYYDNIPGFDGTMKNGVENGYGIRYYENGQIAYKGEWKNGEYDGKGTKYNMDGSVVYSGQWENGDYKN